jgi:hypothetical protein
MQALVLVVANLIARLPGPDDGFAGSLIWLGAMVLAVLAVAVAIADVILTKGNTVANAIANRSLP